jgi:glycosyltransferase involved in cell wall biosynthesis
MVHIYGPSPLVSDLALWRNHDLPHVYSHIAEIVWINRILSAAYRKFHSLLARNARAVIVMTHDYAGLFNGRAKVISPPIHYKPSNGTPQKATDFTVLYAGQLRPFKGVEVLLRAARSLPRVRWIIAGSGGWAEQRYVKQIENSPNVTYRRVENDEELARLYEICHAIAVPAVNTTEAFSLAATEAALFGCVPVASDLRGVRENMKNIGGIVFPTGSSESLAGVIRGLHDNPDLWREYSRSCRKGAMAYAAENTVDRYARDHEALFELVV